MKKSRGFRQDLSDFDDAMETAAGPAELALDGNREALKAWTALVTAYLRSQTSCDFKPSQHGFPQPYEDHDARACLHHLAEALDRIHNGEEPNRAFGWSTGKKGRPRKTQSSPRRAVLDGWRMEEVDRLTAAGLSVGRACEVVAGAFGDSPERLEQLHKRSG